jgi:UPF0271 protein
VKTDINCDLGEMSDTGYTPGDEAVMPFITSANIACGLHAGSPLTMERTVLLARKHHVAVGAHPGYPDREGFGRKNIALSQEELRATILYQVGALKTISEAYGIKLQHVKCHGALYNEASVNYDMAIIIAEAVRDIDPSLIIVGLSGSEMLRAAEQIGLMTASEVFADREYNDDGSLVARSLPGAVLHDKRIVTHRAVKMVKDRSVISVSGKVIPLQADTICIHGDNPQAPELAKELINALRSAGTDVKPMGHK